jgi:hypothetical protein
MKGVLMDGYAITKDAATAFAAFGHPDVRHVAELDDGRGFVAFTGRIPCAGAILENDEGHAFWWRKVRGVAPLAKVRLRGPAASDETERFHLFANGRDFVRNDLSVVRMASLLTGGRVLALTAGEDLGHVLWSARATRFLDKRLAA